MLTTKISKSSKLHPAARLSVAPMMDWTDRHCRYFHRLMSRHALLYTEMVTAPALIHGDAPRLLAFDVAEHPVALQIGGSDPDQLAQATKMGVDAGYVEVNLNVGCPSDRVQSGAFGAVLMKQPDLVADCVQAMIEASGGTKITVKCRIGVDDQIPEDVLPDFIARVSAAGINSFAIHARMAWLDGLSPKENRYIPPLNYDLVHQIKADNPHLEIVLNGGLKTLAEAKSHIDRGLDGAMIGREAYHNPLAILGQTDDVIFDDPLGKTAPQIVGEMVPYITNHIENGGKLHQITRHMLGLFSGQAGARHWKRHLSENAHKTGADAQVVQDALNRVLNIQTAAIDA
ncbi:tRNA-dihydrouridine(20/20a) synthase [Amylibacter ulvae]|uniref:tRNA-dihydrouridine(20/20a) synthase n=1 Tax=Paramylibacter ulvae TaxID=1651968 RepID=A0ABQ3D1L8_9RHOB|nr:tRNA dihydrouridine(20/20a) synthase DusA [Amylibacter ulvae]GHA53113.1 tRNA-dihydrouridine(20/20a) synthase [Amylibacter ulvae]